MPRKMTTGAYDRQRRELKARKAKEAAMTTRRLCVAQGAPCDPVCPDCVEPIEVHLACRVGQPCEVSYEPCVFCGRTDVLPDELCPWGCAFRTERML